MQTIINSSKDFRIIPEKFESSTICKLLQVSEEDVHFELSIATDEELSDFIEKDEVEIFASSQGGLIYFVTKILSKDGRNIVVQIPEDCKRIQRREYSRVNFQGNLTFIDYKDCVLKVDDISAGGLKFVSSIPLEEQLEYNICIELSNNLTIRCSMQPIRISKFDYEGKSAYSVSGKFQNIESIDRIALVQYSFRALTEAENLENKN